MKEEITQARRFVFLRLTQEAHDLNRGAEAFERLKNEWNPLPRAYAIELATAMREAADTLTRHAEKYNDGLDGPARKGRDDDSERT